ncbi:hypothetical protein AX15_003517 [Amanita polypyramis BW_CC]|nr:hypothetical protein AX15_003517 [Amanita polypyramis BW_CC]
MLHFPSSSSRSDSLNATQSKSQSNPLLLTVEEELRDARRAQSHGQEEDLRAALTMVISRVAELLLLLNEAYKAQADLEVQLNVAKSNLQLVISNNEMLEEALKRETNGHTQDVGWHRASRKEGDAGRRESAERPKSLDHSSSNPGSAANSPVVPPSVPAPAPPSTQDSRFFRFRFTGSTSARPVTRPTTPSGSGAFHLTSPSMPALPTIASREMEELASELEKERTARKTVAKEKAALEAELESLSQALFEEANKMVATERMKRAETEEELREAQLEREALRSALRIIEGENSHLRGGNRTAPPSLPSTSATPTTSTSPNQELGTELKPPLVFTRTRSRSSSQIAFESPVTSPYSSVQDGTVPSSIVSPPPTGPDTESESEPPIESIPEDKPEPLEQVDDASTTPIRSSFKIPLAPPPKLGDGDNNDILPPPSSSVSVPLASSLSSSSLMVSSLSAPHIYEDVEPSPWADVPSRTSIDSNSDIPNPNSSVTPRGSLFATPAVYAMQ